MRFWLPISPRLSKLFQYHTNYCQISQKNSKHHAKTITKTTKHHSKITKKIPKLFLNTKNYQKLFQNTKTYQKLFQKKRKTHSCSALPQLCSAVLSCAALRLRACGRRCGGGAAAGREGFRAPRTVAPAESDFFLEALEGWFLEEKWKEKAFWKQTIFFLNLFGIVQRVCSLCWLCCSKLDSYMTYLFAIIKETWN